MSLHETAELKKGMVRQKHLRCDGCGKRYYFCFEITSTLRSYLKEFPMCYPEGWKRVDIYDGMVDCLDLCPECAHKEVVENPLTRCS